MDIVVLISGNGSNLQAIIDQLHKRNKVRIAAVISNRTEAAGLNRARLAQIPVQLIEHKNFPDREAFDLALMQTIDQYQPQLVVLAGFMRILSADFVDHYKNRLINIHPSLLPDFRGLNTHERALQAGVKEHGASVHFVTEDLDSGPVVMQGKVKIRENDTAESLAERVLKVEHKLYPLVIDCLACDRISVKNGQIWFEGAIINQPLQLDSFDNLQGTLDHDRSTD